jgi:hypothetical protein
MRPACPPPLAGCCLRGGCATSNIRLAGRAAALHTAVSLSASFDNTTLRRAGGDAGCNAIPLGGLLPAGCSVTRLLRATAAPSASSTQSLLAAPRPPPRPPAPGVACAAPCTLDRRRHTSRQPAAAAATAAMSVALLGVLGPLPASAVCRRGPSTCLARQLQRSGVPALQVGAPAPQPAGEARVWAPAVAAHGLGARSAPGPAGARRSRAAGLRSCHAGGARRREVLALAEGWDGMGWWGEHRHGCWAILPDNSHGPRGLPAGWPLPSSARRATPKRAIGRRRAKTHSSSGRGDPFT